MRGLQALPPRRGHVLAGQVRAPAPASAGVLHGRRLGDGQRQAGQRRLQRCSRRVALVLVVGVAVLVAVAVLPLAVAVVVVAATAAAAEGGEVAVGQGAATGPCRHRHHGLLGVPVGELPRERVRQPGVQQHEPLVRGRGQAPRGDVRT